MARIPRRDDAGVSLNAVPGNRQSSPAPIEAFGGQYAEDIGKVGEAISKVAGAMMDRAMKEKQRNDEIVVLSKLGEVDNKFNEADRAIDANEFITDEPKHPEGWSDRRISEFDKAAGEIGGTITDRRQAKLFEEKLAERKLNLANKIRQEEAKAWDNFQVGKLSRVLEDSVAAVGEDTMDGPSREYYIARARDAAGKIASLKGDTTGELQAKTNDAIYSTIILGDLDKRNVAGAKSVLDSAVEGGYLSPKTKDELTDAVQTAGWQGDASLLVRKHGNENAALAAIPKDAVPKQRDEMAKVIKQEFAEQRRLQKVREEDAARTANELFDRGQPVPRRLLEAMGSDNRRAFDKHMKKVAAGDTTFDEGAFSDLNAQLLAAQAAGQRFDVDLNQYRDVLGSKFGLLVKAQSSWNEKVAQGSTSFEQRVALLTEELPKDAKAMFNSALVSEMSRLEAGERILSFDEKMKIANSLLAQTIVSKDWAVDPKQPAYVLTPEQRAKLPTPGDDVEYLIPDDFRNENQGLSELALQSKYKDFILGL